MTRYKQKLHRLMESSFVPFREVPHEQVGRIGDRVLEHLRRQPEWESAELRRDVGATRPLVLRWALPTATVIALAIGIAIFFPTKVFQGAPAVFEDSAGARRIAYGELVHSKTPDGGTLKLRDGSTVELRTESQLSLEPSKRGIQVRLRNGDVIVSNAVRSELPLQVQTKDMSAEGEIFMVSAKEEGSRVAVIGGEARVVQGSAERTLHPGEQVATVPSKEVVTVGERISWSREAVSYLAALQEATTTPAQPGSEFEASAIHENTSGLTSSRLEHGAERVTISNATPEAIIRFAFRDYKTKISGPVLLNSKRYNVVAKAPSGTTDPELLVMLQTLLVDRFNMKFHRETSEMPVYALTVGKDGHKLKELKPGETISGRGSGTGSSSGAVGLSSLTMMGDMQNLATSLSRQLDRPVVDKTNLSGRFSVVLAFVPPQRVIEGASGPSIFVAVQEQLGLRLDAQRGPVEILVIDQLQEPTPN